MPLAKAIREQRHAGSALRLHEMNSDPYDFLRFTSVPQKKNPGSVLPVRLWRALPPGRPSSTIGAEGLNYCVRNGYRCFPLAIATGTLSSGSRIGASVTNMSYVVFDN
jgi:hypothetical protein